MMHKVDKGQVISGEFLTRTRERERERERGKSKRKLEGEVLLMPKNSSVYSYCLRAFFYILIDPLQSQLIQPLSITTDEHIPDDTDLVLLELGINDSE